MSLKPRQKNRYSEKILARRGKYQGTVPKNGQSLLYNINKLIPENIRRGKVLSLNEQDIKSNLKNAGIFMLRCLRKNPNNRGKPFAAVCQPLQQSFSRTSFDCSTASNSCGSNGKAMEKNGYKPNYYFKRQQNSIMFLNLQMRHRWLYQYRAAF